VYRALVVGVQTRDATAYTSFSIVDDRFLGCQSTRHHKLTVTITTTIQRTW